MAKLKLGYELKKIRKSINLKQSELSKLLNLSTKTIQRYEKGENVPLEYIENFCSQLNLSDDEITKIYELFLGDTKINGDLLVHMFEQIYNMLGYTFEYKLIDNQHYTIIKTKNTGSDKNTFMLDYDFLELKSSLLLAIMNDILSHELKMQKITH